MNHIKKLIGLIAGNCFIIAVFVLCTTLPLNATTITVDTFFYGVKNVDIVFDEQKYHDIDAGELIIYFGDDDQNALPAFCVDLHTPLFYGENTINEIVTPSDYDTENGLYVEWLMDSFSLQLGYVNTDIYDNENEDEGGLWWHLQSAGLQLAIWKTLYGDKFSYESTSVDSYVSTYYNFFITQLSDEIENDFGYTSKGKYNVVKLSANEVDKQDLITIVPEPATFMLFVIGLLGLGAIGRKKDNLSSSKPA